MEKQKKGEVVEAGKKAWSCWDLRRNYQVEAGITWGSLPAPLQLVWKRLKCDDMMKQGIDLDGEGLLSYLNLYLRLPSVTL